MTGTPKVSDTGDIGNTQVTNIGSNVQICSIITNQGVEPSLNSWLTPYLTYLMKGHLPSDLTKAQAVKKNAAKYIIVKGRLFR